MTSLQHRRVSSMSKTNFVTQPQEEMRNLAENRGTGWSQVCSNSSLHSFFSLICNMEQSRIGKGVVDKLMMVQPTCQKLTGATTLLGNASGMATGTNGLVSVTYRGEENFGVTFGSSLMDEYLLIHITACIATSLLRKQP